LLGKYTVYTGWGNQLLEQNDFFQCIGLHVLLKLKHQFNLNIICLCDGLMAAAEGAQILRMYSAASQSHYAAVNECRAARLALGVTWTFACKMLQRERSSKFKPGKYGRQFAGTQNSANSLWVVLAV
jgi:hypothetical protein